MQNQPPLNPTNPYNEHVCSLPREKGEVAVVFAHPESHRFQFVYVESGETLREAYFRGIRRTDSATLYETGVALQLKDKAIRVVIADHEGCMYQFYLVWPWMLQFTPEQVEAAVKAVVS